MKLDLPEPSRWTLSKWKQLTESPSPFVRKWVAQNARIYLDKQARIPFINRLLKDERAPVRMRARYDLLETLMPDQADRYLGVALEEDALRKWRINALEALAELGYTKHLTTWLQEVSERIQKASSPLENNLQELFSLPVTLIFLSPADAAPLAELLFTTLEEVIEEDLFDFEQHKEPLGTAVAGLMLSHPRPGEMLDFLGRL
ncbi:MAG: hypothetical protein K9K64_13235 [Desulfohalobiaceae bacterium]|nr:hypothetical protein [Desulfohalobiaceae bacterium]